MDSKSATIYGVRVQVPLWPPLGYSSMVERGPLKPYVGGSSPPTPFRYMVLNGNTADSRSAVPGSSPGVPAPLKLHG